MAACGAGDRGSAGELGDAEGDVVDTEPRDARPDVLPEASTWNARGSDVATDGTTVLDVSMPRIDDARDADARDADARDADARDADARDADASDVESSPFPLRTRGRYVVDARGARVKLASVNWYGASDTKRVVGGLDVAKIGNIVSAIKKLGFNSVRLPFANVMLHEDHVDASAVKANPDLASLKPIEVYDRVVEALTSAGVMVVLNNHTTHPMWCCNLDTDELWYTSDYSEQQWLDDWAMMATRYRKNPRVIAADLRNEVRPRTLAGTSIPDPLFPT